MVHNLSYNSFRILFEIIFSAILTFVIACFSPLNAGNIRLESTRLSVSNGLACNTVNDIQQGHDGYIWMATVDGISRYDGYSFVNFTKPDAAVSQVMPDNRYGVIWGYSSNQLLCCYDQKRAKLINYNQIPEGSNLLKNRVMTNNGIWLASADYGVRHLIYRDGKFISTDYTVKNGGIASGNNILIKESLNNNIWIATDKGLNRISPDGKSHGELRGKDVIVLTCEGNRTAAITKQGDAYVFNNNGKIILRSHLASMMGFAGKSRASMFWKGYWYIFTQNKTFAMNLKTGIFSVPQEQIPYATDKGILNSLKTYKMLYDKEGNAYIFGKNGLFRKFNLLRDKSIIGARDKNFVAAEDACGRMFIASYGSGLFVYDPKDDTLQHFSANDKEPLFHTDFLLNVFIDRSGCIWVGTANGGAYKLRELDGLTYKLIKMESDAKMEWNNAVRHIANMGNGNIAVSTRVNKTYIYNVYTKQKKLALTTKACVYCYTKDHEGRTWIGTKGEGIIIDGTTYSKFDKTHYLPSAAFYDVVFDKHGRSWMATWGDGLIVGKLDGKGKLKYRNFLTQNGKEAQMHDAVIDSRGLLWIASDRGIIIVDTRKKNISDKDFMRFNNENGLFPANRVICCMTGKDGSVWCGTNKGAFRCTYDMKTLKINCQQFSASNGLISDMITAIVQDAYGNTWIGTEEGLSRVNAKTLDMRSIRMEGDINDNNFSEGCAVRLEDGTLAFGVASGLLIIKPDKTLELKRKDMNVVVTDIKINGISIYDEKQDSTLTESLNVKGEISLPADKNSLAVFYSNFNYPNIKSAMYQYYLEGIDRTWRPMISVNHADFSDLNPGHYTLHIRTLTGNRKWSKETTLKITIREPLYNTWLAWIIYMFIMGGVGMLFYRSWRRNFDLNQQIKLEKRMSDFRIEFFTHISHEFRTPLAIIQSAVEKATAAEDRNIPRNVILTMRRGTKRLQRLIDQLMEFRRANTGNLKLAVEEGDIIVFIRNIYADLKQIAQQKGINMTFTPWTSNYRMFFDPEKVETIVYNLLSNAVKYTPDKGMIMVRLTLDESYLKFIVEDNGPGIKPEREMDLFKPFMHGYVSKGGMGIGLYNAHEMAVLHKGSLTYRRSQGENALGGSIFTLVLPTCKDIYKPEDFAEQRAIDAETTDREETDIIVKEMTPEAINDITVMVIEDDPDMMEQIKSELSTYFKVKAFMNGKTGFENIKKIMPALLISDIMLPEMSGYEIVSNMKADPVTQDIPVIMLTAFDDANHKLKAYKNFIDDYMVKPCDFKLLIARALQFVAMDMKTKREKEKKDALSAEAAAVNDATTDKNNVDAAEEKTEKPAAKSTEPTILMSTLDKKFKDKLQFIVAQHISDQTFNVDRLAELLNVGRTSAYNRTKAVMGVSPNMYIQNERLRIASELLLEGEYTVSEVSEKVGFSDAAYFYKCFKNKYGVAPSKYGKQKPHE